MLSLILFLIIVYIVLGIIGFVVQGLFWLFVLAVILFAITFISSIFQAGSRRALRRHRVKKQKDEETKLDG